MALPMKPSNPGDATTVPAVVNVAPALPGAPRRRGTGGLYPRLMTSQVSEEMYAAVKAEVARRAAAGEPSDVASMGAIVRESLAMFFARGRE